MSTTPHIQKLWKCPKCGRKFQRTGQAHSCGAYPLNKHFEGKPRGRILYQALKEAVRGQIGRFKVESLQCCIHFVSAITFTAVRIFQDKLGVEFSLNREIKSKRIKRRIQMSARRYLYFVDVIKQEEIDKDLMGWLREAYEPA